MSNDIFFGVWEVHICMHSSLSCHMWNCTEPGEKMGRYWKTKQKSTSRSHLIAIERNLNSSGTNKLQPSPRLPAPGRPSFGCPSKHSTWKAPAFPTIQDLSFLHLVILCPAYVDCNHHSSGPGPLPSPRISHVMRAVSDEWTEHR